MTGEITVFSGWSPTCWLRRGATRVLTMALHAPQVHGFFSVPVDHLNAVDVLADHFRSYDLSNTVVVSPDLGMNSAFSWSSQLKFGSVES